MLVQWFCVQVTSRESECEHLWFEPPGSEFRSTRRRQTATTLRGLGYFRGPAVEVRRSREGPLAASEREREREEEPVEVFWRQSGGFPVEVGLEGKKEPGAPGASGIPQQEAGRLRSGQRRLRGAEWSV